MPQKLSIGTIKIDTASKRAYVDGKDMNLNSKETSLLEQFIQNPQKIMTGEYLYEKVWGQKMLGDDTALRIKLQDIGAEYTITVSRGEGYYLELKQENK
ncbi:MAG: winged helix-turn-helix domain-containing protein [Defluviitaleaceae bacterium]|nr:winged helix-turn-helix domain-containing protein [Defluviitaleaceae bacterium]